MFSYIDIWEALAGVAIFMLGSNFMDESLHSLMGRKFKLFLKKQTDHKLRAVTGGFLFSGILQSSSIANLLILSFAGAGVITLSNALAVILGSNLGSTATNWLVASLGFDPGMETMAFALAGITGIAIAYIYKGTHFYHWCRLLFGFSFLFIGLGFIKSGMADMISHTNLNALSNYPLIIFALAGLLITALVQSSAATVAFILSSLYVHAITLPEAMAVVLGSEAGTTFKLFLAPVKDNPVKKRIAFGNLLFNLVPAVLFIALIYPCHAFITRVIAIQNELYALVFFQTMVNLGSILLFLPVLHYFSRWLTSRFNTTKSYFLAIDKKITGHGQNSLAALEQDSAAFIRLVLRFCKSAVYINRADNGIKEKKPGTHLAENYNQLKSLHGELHGYYIKTIKEDIPAKEKQRLGQLAVCLRNGLYAAKSIKDAAKDIAQLHNSANDAKYYFYLQAKEKVGSFCDRAAGILERDSEEPGPAIFALYNEIQKSYEGSLRELYSDNLSVQLNEQEISTLINFNRETYTAFKSIVFALKAYMLEGKQANDFDTLPGFIH